MDGTDEEGSPTKLLAVFVASTTQEIITSEIVNKLKVLFLDYLGVSASAAFRAESSQKFLSAMENFAGSVGGKGTVLTKGSTFLPQYAALLNGAWCHTYDFDDTHAKAVLHPGSSVISAALAEAETIHSSGSDFLLALAVGYEVACRLGNALGLGGYPRGFHNTGTAGLYGAIAAVCKLRKSSQQVVEDAFGLAVSKAAGSMQFLENGAWNKRLHPGFAAHDALLCVALASAGVIGATKPIEGKYGLLHSYSENADCSRSLDGLGREWIFLETACKPFPACRMTHGQIEMAANMRKEYERHGIPEQILISLPKSCFPVVGNPAANKINPQCIVDAQFSSYFQTAAVWLYGDQLGWEIYEKIRDPAVQDLCRRINCQIEESYVALESKVKITFKDGLVVEGEIIFPIGEKERPFDWEKGVRRKFMGLSEPVYGKERSEEVCKLVGSLEGTDVPSLMMLVK
ncbi:hypothetical protein N7510_010516 [Penicillium lagena]|uniref:uncharacterized protein n=1 Tax=Penicillium lagena TaxID=94218 RepID=UPI0025410E9B|nr:uncharacterized protein N7510_010516 [Penicillium lagena]KAJ5605362.1 hypothetical protein N7510_010516 [Penicillium lagena]